MTVENNKRIYVGRPAKTFVLYAIKCLEIFCFNFDQNMKERSEKQEIIITDFFDY